MCKLAFRKDCVKLKLSPHASTPAYVKTRLSQGGGSGARPSFKICAPRFMFGLPVTAYIQYSM